jgi:hypothetical protein
MSYRELLIKTLNDHEIVVSPYYEKPIPELKVGEQAFWYVYVSGIVTISEVLKVASGIINGHTIKLSFTKDREFENEVYSGVLSILVEPKNENI